MACSDDEPFVFDASSDSDEELSSSSSDRDESAWDFGAYSEAVAEEHARRNTTSVDHKIQKLRQNSSLLNSNHEDDDDDDDDDDNNQSSDSDSDSESDVSLPNKQEDEDEDGGDEDNDDDDEEENDDGVEENADDVEENDGKKPFFASADGVSYQATPFMDLNLSRPLLRACEALGYTKSTPIQAACLPAGMGGRDICASAITGSGKTAAFALPTLERLLYRPKREPAIRVLILTPTRELAAQVHSMIEKLAKFTDIRCCLIVGGLSAKVQEAALRSRPDIVVATPGRMIDHLRNSMSVDLDDLSVLILDEADRLLELGFSAEIQELVRMCSKKRQTMLFSATMTEEVDELVKLSLNNPLRISADPSAQRPAALIEEVIRIRRAREAHQEAVLLALCSKTFTSKVIIFSGTKLTAHRLKILFGLAGLKAAEIHADLTQAQRLDSLELFRKQEADFLFATDVAARGLDIVGIQTVINFACPRDLNTYVHRVGRTARAGRGGRAVTFVTDNDRSLLKSIAKKAGSKLKSRIVSEQSINKWVQNIEQMEDQVATILLEEKEEMELRKAEMEAMKAQNLIEHREEIFSRPKKTWFMTQKEKKSLEKEMKASLEKGKNSDNDIVSVKKAEELKIKEKRKREREKNLPRKKRRKLEAAREMLEEGKDSDDPDEDVKKNKADKGGIPLVDVAYRRAKAVKAGKKALDSGKRIKKMGKKAPQPQSRTEEMRELFQTDMSERRLKKNTQQVGKKSKSSFKSKSRYKRRK